MDTETLKKSTWMRKAEVRETSLDSCKETYLPLVAQKSLSEGILQTQLCARSVNKVNASDTCQGMLSSNLMPIIYANILGDSGGPIQFESKRQNGEKQDVYYVVGVTSVGIACGSQMPGVYTRVAEYLEWIERVVWPAQSIGSRFREDDYYDQSEAQEEASEETLMKAENDFKLAINRTFGRQEANAN